MRSVTVSFRLSQDSKAVLDRLAQLENISISTFASRIIREFLAQEKSTPEMVRDKIREDVALQILPREVMRGFCYTYAKLLLGKLQKLSEDDRVFERGAEEAQEHHSSVQVPLTEIASSVAHELANQIRYTAGKHPLDSFQGIKNLILTANEFLAIFKR